MKLTTACSTRSSTRLRWSIRRSKKRAGLSTSARPNWPIRLGVRRAGDAEFVWDILSDVAAQIAGSVGLAGSANIGLKYAMFEAIHGSAPRRAGQNLANPSGLLLGAVMMLVHIGQQDVAERVHNAFLRTLEDGIHTYDIAKEGRTRIRRSRWERRNSARRSRPEWGRNAEVQGRAVQHCTAAGRAGGGAGKAAAATRTGGRRPVRL